MTTNITQEDVDELLPAEHISLEEPPGEKRACIEHLLDILVDAGRVSDRDRALEALLERETQTTTGVGLGIGIPHAKTDAVSRPSVAFVRSNEGIDFEAMDDEPATLLFMILVPESGADEHLAILSALSRSLVHEAVRDGLHGAESAAEVRSIVREALA